MEIYRTPYSQQSSQLGSIRGRQQPGEYWGRQLVGVSDFTAPSENPSYDPFLTRLVQIGGLEGQDSARQCS